jgi:hypothetical protein
MNFNNRAFNDITDKILVKNCHTIPLIVHFRLARAILALARRRNSARVIPYIARCYRLFRLIKLIKKIRLELHSIKNRLAHEHDTAITVFISKVKNSLSSFKAKRIELI